MSALFVIRKQSLDIREFALCMEGLERLVKKEQLR